MQTYLFYDIETTGLSKSFDQILQFAAIRTDLNLQEIKRYEYKVKLNCDVIPHPGALITHHIGTQELQKGMSEIDAIKDIHSLMNESGTISLGYNTLGFDDEFLRFSFYRHMLPPYTHQFANQCYRMDLYPMTVMYFLFKNHVLKWPEKNGKLSLKLEELNKANQLASGQAHNAMVDVEATLALAKCFYQESDMWKYLIEHFNKNIDQKRSHVPVHTDMLMSYGKFGSEQKFLSPVLFLGYHRHYKHQMWLRLDTEKLIETKPGSIKETTWAVRKKIGEPGFILPRKEQYLAHLKPEVLALADSNKQWLKDNPDLLKQITEFHIDEKYPNYPEADIEARIYMDGFLSDEDYQLSRKFHSYEPKEKAGLIDHFKNKKLRMLAVRLLGRHYPDVLTVNQADEFAGYLQKINQDQAMIDYRGEKRLTAKEALRIISELRREEGLSEVQVGLLGDLESYLLARFNPL